AQGLVEVDHDDFGAVKLTAAARPVLKGETTVTLRRLRPKPARLRTRERDRAGDRTGDRTGASPAAAAFSRADADLFER
ncbi:hypothetical protein J8J27_34880, partial [Mycobacterium tuberculosis]|nr:hypothetical protein [Mycobacterium tuberculosis]